MVQRTAREQWSISTHCTHSHSDRELDSVSTMPKSSMLLTVRTPATFTPCLGPAREEVTRILMTATSACVPMDGEETTVKGWLMLRMVSLVITQQLTD